MLYTRSRLGASARGVARRASRCRSARTGTGGRRRESPAGKKEIEGAKRVPPPPVDRGRRGSKHRLLVDGGGVPLAWTLTGGNRNNVTQLIELIDSVPPVRGRVGCETQTKDNARRRRLRPRQVPPARLAARHQTGERRPQTDHGTGLGRQHWAVERTVAWLHNHRRLLIRTDPPRRHPQGFLALACCLICRRRLETSLS